MIEILKKYCPVFILENDLLNDLFTVIGDRLTEAKSAIMDLKNANWSGEGLKLSLIENNILVNADKTEIEKRTLLTSRFDDNSLRGTENGITNDLQNLLNQSGTVSFYNSGECGIILNNTYPGIDQHAFINAKKVIKVNYADAELHRSIIEQEIIPIDVTLII